MTNLFFIVEKIKKKSINVYHYALTNLFFTVKVLIKLSTGDN